MVRSLLQAGVFSGRPGGKVRTIAGRMRVAVVQTAAGHERVTNEVSAILTEPRGVGLIQKLGRIRPRLGLVGAQKRKSIAESRCGGQFRRFARDRLVVLARARNHGTAERAYQVGANLGPPIQAGLGLEQRVLAAAIAMEGLARVIWILRVAVRHSRATRCDGTGVSRKGTV